MKDHTTIKENNNMKKTLILPFIAMSLFVSGTVANAATVAPIGKTAVVHHKNVTKKKIAKKVIKKTKKVVIKKQLNKTTIKPVIPTISTNKQQTTKPVSIEKSSTLSAFELKVVELTNVERQKAGLKPLAIDNELSKVARIKSQDMTEKHYFDHNSPTYGSPFDMMKHFGITYTAAAENIAKGQKTPEEVVNAWMNSAGHRGNILNGKLTYIGVGYDSRENTWTQQFISK